MTHRMDNLATAVVVALLLGCGGGSVAGTLSACGEVGSFNGCLFFWRFDEPGTYVLPDSGFVPPPGIYHITAETYYGPPACGQFYDWCLREVVIETCPPETLGCGVIRYVEDSENRCTLWTALSGGPTYGVDHLGEYAVGDTVTAIGIPCHSCAGVPGTCADYGQVAFEMRFAPCGDTLSPTLETSWGRIKLGYRE